MPSDPITAAILGGVGAFTNLFTASKAAKAAKDAAALQVAATKRGQIYADQAHADQNALMNPYVQAGQLSLADLQARLYGGTRESYMPKQPPPTAGPQLSGDQRAISEAYQANLGRPASLAEIQNRMADPNFDILRHQADIAKSPEAQAYAARGGQPQQPQPQSLAAMQQQQPGPPQPMPGPPQGGGAMVKLQGPDGSVRDVPAELADRFIAKGARRIG